jgi:DNA polymerase-4
MTLAGGEEIRRVIAHVDADAFYASVHLLEDPSLAGKPVIVAGTGARSIVTTASYEARKFGVHSAQPTSTAVRLCPQATFIRPNFALYRDYSQRAMEIVRSYTDVVQPLSLDEAYLDLTELEQPIAAMREMVTEILENVGLRYSVGIGPNKLCAKVLSDFRKPAAFNVASREQCCELFADASPRLIPGIGPKSTAALGEMGISTLAALRAADRDTLVEAFGANRADELVERANFHSNGFVESDREVKSVSEERTFGEDVADIDELERRMVGISTELSERLTQRDLRGRTVGIKVRLDDFTTVTRARTIESFVNDAQTISNIACELLREYSPPQPVRLIGVRIATFEGATPPETLPPLERAGQLVIPGVRLGAGIAS